MLQTVRIQYQLKAWTSCRQQMKHFLLIFSALSRRLGFLEISIIIIRWLVFRRQSSGRRGRDRQSVVTKSKFRSVEMSECCVSECWDVGVLRVGVLRCRIAVCRSVKLSECCKSECRDVGLLCVGVLNCRNAVCRSVEMSDCCVSECWDIRVLCVGVLRCRIAVCRSVEMSEC